MTDYHPKSGLENDCMSLWLNQAAAACGLEPEVLGAIITDAAQMAEGGATPWATEDRLRKSWPDMLSSVVAWGRDGYAIEACRRGYHRIPVAFWGAR